MMYVRKRCVRTHTHTYVKCCCTHTVLYKGHGGEEGDLNPQKLPPPWLRHYCVVAFRRPYGNVIGTPMIRGRIRSLPQSAAGSFEIGKSIGPGGRCARAPSPPLPPAPFARYRLARFDFRATLSTAFSTAFVFGVRTTLRPQSGVRAVGERAEGTG